MSEADFENALANERDRLILIGDQAVPRLSSLREMATSKALAAVRSTKTPLLVLNLHGIREAMSKKEAEMKAERESN